MTPQLTPEEIERLNRDAETVYPYSLETINVGLQFAQIDRNLPLREAYIKAATAERLKAKALLEALENIKECVDGKMVLSASQIIAEVKYITETTINNHKNNLLK